MARISNSLLISQSALDIQLLFERINAARQDLSTGKRVRQPSDDPVGFAEVANFRLVLNANATIKSNISESRSFLEVTEGALTSTNQILQRGRQLAVRGLTDVLTQNDRQLIVRELDNLLEQFLGTANTKFGDEFVFSGQRLTTQPFTTPGTPIQSVTYNGDGNLIFRDVGITTLVSINLPGDQVFLGGADPNRNAFQALLNLRNEFRDGNMVSLTPLNNTSQTITAAEAAGTTLDTLTTTNQLATPLTATATGSFTVNGATINYNTAVDTINAVLGRINTAGVGVSATYDDVTQRVILTSTNGRLIDVKDVSGNFTAAMHVVSPLSHFDTALNNITDFLGRIGSTLKQLDLADVQNQNQFQSITASLSRVEDTDAARRIVDLSLSTSSFQAALNVTARAIPPTLLDFLR